MRCLAGLVLWVWLTTGAGASPCKPGARLDYPLSEVLGEEAWSYAVEAITRDDIPPDPEPALRNAGAFAAVMRERSAALPEPLADLPYLILLWEKATYPDPLYSLTYLEPSTVLPEIVAAAERHGLSAEARFLRTPLTLWPDWDAGPAERMADRAAVDGGLRGLALRAASTALHGSEPRILAATEALIASDPDLAAEFEARREGADRQRRVDHLAWRLISECLAGWWTPEEADAAFAEMGPAQADILLMHFFLAESFNGSAHQYFWNSSGTMAPQLAALLDRIGLPDHAAGVRQGMAVFPAPYPRDTDARREIMATFSEAQDDALYAITAWADDGMILEAMARLAEESGLMPR
jgi:hypothetical protein